MNNNITGKVTNPEAIYGKSAYEIAVANGFNGTVEEWLVSLSGDGKTPYIQDGYWYIGGKSTNVKAEPTLDDINAAPAGFGLGSNNATIVTDANNAVQIGFYRFGAENSVNHPSAFYAFRYGSFIVNRANDTVQQIAIYENLLAVRYGYVNSKTWSEWEYINPPMEVGIEYRTTERWNGKAVYTSLLNLGYAPNKGSIVVNTNITATEAFRVAGRFSSANLTLITPFSDGDNEVSACVYVESNNIYARINSNFDTSDRVVWVQVWYIKE